MSKNYLLIYSEQLATEIVLLYQNIKAPSNTFFKSVKAQAAFMQKCKSIPLGSTI